MKYSKAGLWLAAVYLIPATPLVVWAMTISDPAGHVFIATLAAIPASLLVTYTGLVPAVMSHWWLNNIFAMVLLSVAVLYLIGWTIEAAVRIATRSR